MQNTHLRNRHLTAVSTARQTIGLHGRPISAVTVRRRLKANGGLKARRPYVGIVLTPRHRRLRLNWARRHLRWTRAQWARVLFTDESRYMVQKADGRARVYRRDGERYKDACIIERDQFGGGSLMVWAGISLHTKTALVRVLGNLNAARYREEILRQVMLPHIRANGPMVFMQDNAPPHTARETMRFLQGNNVRVLDWPPRSPDLNPIENIWDEVDRRLRELPVQLDLAQLDRDIHQVWQGLPQRFLHDYINSMRSRCQAVIEAHGGHIPY